MLGFWLSAASCICCIAVLSILGLFIAFSYAPSGIKPKSTALWAIASICVGSPRVAWTTALIIAYKSARSLLATVERAAAGVISNSPVSGFILGVSEENALSRIVLYSGATFIPSMFM